MSAVAHIDEYKQGKFFSDEFRGNMSWNGYENNVMLRHQGSGSVGVPQFLDVARGLGVDGEDDARGVAAFDYDNDGDLDLVVNHHPGDRGVDSIPVKLYRNDIGGKSHWIVLSLEGVQSNRDGVGARVILTSGTHQQVRHVVAGSGYASQGDQRLFFGLGDRKRVDQIVVRWPSGLEETYRDFEVNRWVNFKEGSGFELVNYQRQGSRAGSGQ